MLPALRIRFCKGLFHLDGVSVSLLSRLFFLVALSPIVNVELTSLRSGSAMSGAMTTIVFTVFSFFLVAVFLFMVFVRKVLRRRKKEDR